MEVRECNDDLHFVRSLIVVSSPPTVELETSGSEAAMILYLRVRQHAETCEIMSQKSAISAKRRVYFVGYEARE